MSGPDFVAALTMELQYSAVPPEKVIEGSPTIGVAEIGTLGEREYGVWEHSVGASSDVEADEVFVVLSGAATVAFADGSVVELAPGSVGRLREGQQSVWTITETLRKVYFA